MFEWYISRLFLEFWTFIIKFIQNKKPILLSTKASIGLIGFWLVQVCSRRDYDEKKNNIKLFWLAQNHSKRDYESPDINYDYSYGLRALLCVNIDSFYIHDIQNI